MKPLIRMAGLILISSVSALAAEAGDLTLAREMQSSLTRVGSRAMVRVVERPDLRSLDVAAWDRNPLFHYPMDATVQTEEVASLQELDFGGALDAATIRDKIAETPLTTNEQARPLAWQPLMKYLLERDYDLAAPLLVTGAAVSAERWGAAGARPLQQIALAWLRGDQLWVKVEFRPEITWVPATDEDGDGYPEIYARLAVDPLAQELLELITSDYCGRVLSADEVDEYFYALCSEWYASLMTFLLEGEEAAPWPNAETDPPVAAQMGGLTISSPTAVIRAQPYGEAIYNVFVVASAEAAGADARPQNPQPATASAPNPPAASASEGPWDLELARWGGSWEAWEEALQRFRLDVRRLLQDMPEGVNGVAGLDNWLFFRTDLQFLLSRDLSDQPEGKDPWPAIIHFRDQLRARDIDLLMVIIPTKAEIYPEKLSARAPGSEGPWVTPWLRKLLSELDAEGIGVVDLQPAFMAERDSAEEPLYMPQDTHWTNRGVRLAADLIARRVRNYPWYGGLDARTSRYSVQPATVTRLGDIVGMLPEARRVEHRPMQLTAEQVIDADGSFYADDPNSPIVMLGDSFTGVFHFEDCKHAGLSAHLAKELGLPIDLIMAQGSGPRIRGQLARRGADNLAGKRLVIWTLVSRDLHNYWANWDPVELP